MKKRVYCLLAALLCICAMSACSLGSIESKLEKNGFVAVEGQSGMYQKDDAMVLNTPCILIVSLYPEQNVPMATMIQEFDETINIYSLSCESTYMIQKILYKEDENATSELVYDYTTNSIISDVIDKSDAQNAALLQSLKLTYEGVVGYFQAINIELKDFLKEEKDTTDPQKQSNETKLINADFTQDSDTGVYVKQVESFNGKETYYTIKINLDSTEEKVMVTDNLDPFDFNYMFNFEENSVIFNILKDEETLYAEGIYDLKKDTYTYYSVKEGYEQSAITKQEQNAAKIKNTYTFITQYLESLEIDPNSL